MPLLYWTGAAWSLAIASAPSDLALLPDLPRVEILMRRALELQDDYDAGALHEYFVAFDGGRPEAMGGSVDRALQHFDRAMELTAGRRLSPLVTLAENVSVRRQDRSEFIDLLDRVLVFDARGRAPQFRQANLAAQRKAAWLKRRVDDLFLE